MQEDGCERMVNYFVEIGLDRHLDPESIPSKMETVIDIYGGYRATAQWTQQQWNRLRPLLRSIVDLIPLGLHVVSESLDNPPYYIPTGWIFDVLSIRTAIRLIGQDFPELWETLEYSANVVKLDLQTEKWLISPPQMSNQMVMIMVMMFKRWPDHPWWAIGDVAQELKAQLEETKIQNTSKWICSL